MNEVLFQCVCKFLMSFQEKRNNLKNEHLCTNSNKGNFLLLVVAPCVGDVIIKNCDRFRSIFVLAVKISGTIMMTMIEISESNLDLF